MFGTTSKDSLKKIINLKCNQILHKGKVNKEESHYPDSWHVTIISKKARNKTMLS